jgi:hypothetical protein
MYDARLEGSTRTLPLPVAPRRGVLGCPVLLCPSVVGCEYDKHR